MTPNQALPMAWEATALEVLEQLGRPPAPIDSFALAQDLGVRVRVTNFPAAIQIGDYIEVSERASPLRQQWHVAHELGHWALQRSGLVNTEAGADRLGEALALPSYGFEPDSLGWHVGLLQHDHPHCSLETIARRILSLRSACMTVWQRGKMIRRRCSDDVPLEFLRRTRFEALLAGAARQRGGGVVFAGPRLVGFVDDDHPQRVITLCGSHELARLSRRDTT